MTTATMLGALMPVRRPPALDDSRPVICQVLHTLHVGGGEVLARAFALQHERDFRPVFALLDDIGSLGQELKDAGYTVEVISRRPGFDWRCGRRLREFFRRHRVALVHAHQYAPLFYSALARLPGMPLPILFTEHGRDYPDYRRWKRALANRFLFGRRDRFVGVGQCVRRALIDYEGLPADRVEVIYNGSDLAAYDPLRGERDTVRRELSLAADEIAIVQVARLNRLKDHATAIRAMQRLRSAAPRARLLLAGEGEERPAIERLIGELGVSDCVRLLGTRRDVPRLLQGAEIFLLTSVSEGIPLTLIEAMATGLPCVATRVGGVPEVVQDRHTGRLAAPQDHAAIAGLLAELAAQPAQRQALGKAGLERARQLFDHGQMHARYGSAYRQMIA